MNTVSIRPGYIPYTLSAAVLMTAGSALLKTGWVATALVCWAMLASVIAAAALDCIKFDGQTIRHLGPLAFIISKIFRIRRHLAISEIEAITTETTSLSLATGDTRMSYRTRVSGLRVELVVRSHRSTYASFIKL